MTAAQIKIARAHNLALRDPKRPERGWRVICSCPMPCITGGRTKGP